MNIPRITVIIPCYNREVLLRETLDSLLAQTFRDWEVIVIDDHSEDHSLEVAKQYGQLDSRIRTVLRQGDRKGSNFCRNQGLFLALGEYIIFLDSDDLLSRTCLQHRVTDMDNTPDCGFGVYQTELFTHSIGDRRVLWNAFTDSNDLHRFLSVDTVWITTSPIWRKETVAQLGGFDEHVISFQDWDLHVRALIQGIKYYRKHVRDNYHRFQYDEDGQLSAGSVSLPDHLRSHEELFTKTFDELQHRGLVDKEIRCRVAGLFWWLTGLWELRSDFPASKKVWKKALALGLCSRWRYLEGCLILRLHSLRRGQPIVRLIQQFWPLQYIRIGSEHLYKVPVGRTEPDTV